MRKTTAVVGAVVSELTCYFTSSDGESLAQFGDARKPPSFTLAMMGYFCY